MKVTGRLEAGKDTFHEILALDTGWVGTRDWLREVGSYRHRAGSGQEAVKCGVLILGERGLDVVESEGAQKAREDYERAQSRHNQCDECGNSRGFGSRQRSS